MAYIEKELPYSVREEMRQHLEECEDCRAKYEKKLFTREQFSEAFNNEQVVFSSVSAAVINDINSNKYEISSFKRLCNHFKRFGGSYAAVAAMVAFVILIVPRMGGMVKKESISLNKSTEYKAESNGFNKFKSDTDPESHTNLLDNNGDVDKMLKEIKTKELGVGPWRAVYADSNKILLYNYSHLLVYDNSSNKRGIINAVDLVKLNMTNIQGDPVVSFIPSTNGELCVIGNAGSLDMKDEEKKIYIFNEEKNTIQLIGNDNLGDIRKAWSNSSQYFSYVDSRERVNIYDASKDKNDQFTFNKGEVRSMYISDSGDVLINSNKIYLLRKETFYTPVELKVTGETLGFKGNDIIYFNGGTIYQYDLNNSREINNVGKDYVLSENEDKKIVFNNNKDFKVYDITNNELYEYINQSLKSYKSLT